MKILGLSAFYHDSAAALLVDGSVVAAAQQERFSRKKHDASFPTEAIRYCLEQGDVTLSDLTAVVFYDKPLLKFDRLMETYAAGVPWGWKQFVTAMPIWLKEKLFLRRTIEKGLETLGDFDPESTPLLFPEHHLSHAASAFFPSPFDEAAVLTVDGVGEWTTASISHAKGKEIRFLRTMKFPHSVGLLYSAFTWFLGFRVNSGEYKLMGLAPYGNINPKRVERFKQQILSSLVTLFDDGSMDLHAPYFRYTSSLEMIHTQRWEELFALSRRMPDDDLLPEHCDLALAIQQVTEESVLRLASTAKELTGSRNLCLAGGVALNCVANAVVQSSGLFENLWIQPASGDAGGALGSALAAHHIYFDQERAAPEGKDAMKGAFLGPQFSEDEVLQMERELGASGHGMEFKALTEETAGRLANGRVVGWFQGKMEWGPRALGNRSILGDPRSGEMQRKLNLKIKYRESFRPFAPSVLAEYSQDYFEGPGVSPYMLLTAPVKKEHRKELPDDYLGRHWKEKLYFERSSVPAVTHIDFSARLQTVHQETNPRYWKLIEAFRKKAGVPMVVNTSFNVRGEPIVCTPKDAFVCFMNTEMDDLVIGNRIYHKEEQDPALKRTLETQYAPD